MRRNRHKASLCWRGTCFITYAPLTLVTHSGWTLLNNAIETWLNHDCFYDIWSGPALLCCDRVLTAAVDRVSLQMSCVEWPHTHTHTHTHTHWPVHWPVNDAATFFITISAAVPITDRRRTRANGRDQPVCLRGGHASRTRATSRYGEHTRSVRIQTPR